jgi:hypothetical protein
VRLFKTRIHLRGSLDAPWIRRSRAYIARVVFEMLSASRGDEERMVDGYSNVIAECPWEKQYGTNLFQVPPEWEVLVFGHDAPPCEYQGAKCLEDHTRVQRRRAAWRLASRPASRTSKLSMWVSRRAMLKEIWSCYDALLMLSRVTGLNLRSARTGSLRESVG